MDLDQDTRGNLWAIVLAAGEGTRLVSVTRALYGTELPKQFAALTGERTFLQMTMDRISSLVPPDRTVVVVSDTRRALAEAQLADYPGVHIIAQPRNLGTAVGVLLPLAHVLARDPDAQVVIFPSDHHVSRDAPFVDAVRRAVRAARGARSGTALVGAAADSAATDLGWIVPERALGSRDARASRVVGFVEKPQEPVAMRLLAAGALWNTLVIAARGRGLWQLASRRIPTVTEGFDHYRDALRGPKATLAMRELYGRLPSADISRDVLQRSPRGLSVVSLIDAGWSDLGTPERLLSCLNEMGHCTVRERVRRAVARPAREAAVA
jgi:mannose-1-phosphate guanylyltransferase